MSAPKLQQVTLVVGSSEASAAFYRELGLAVPDDAGDMHVEIPQPAGPVSLELDTADTAGVWNASWRAGQGMAVASRAAVDELYGRLTATGHPGVQPPFDAFWVGATPSWLTPTAIRSG